MGFEKTEDVIRPNGLGIRHVQTFFLLLSMIISFSMRVNISMAIVDMTDADREVHFDWSPQVKSVILSSFFWGYVILQIPAGELARKWGGKNLLLASVTINSTISLLLPFTAGFGGWIAVCICRFLQGLTQASVYPGTHHLISQWIPLEEKGLLATIIYAGGVLGISIQLITSGFIASAWGWPAIFYTNGTCGLLWALAYTKYGSASPEQSRMIKVEEVTYIQRSLGRVGEQKRYPTPWIKIITSLPFWALIMAHCGQNWGFFTIMTEIPTFMSQVLNMKLQSNGILSCLPYLAMTILSAALGATADLIIRKKWLTVSQQRKLFNSIGLFGPAIALIALTFDLSNNIYAVVMLIVAVGINAGIYTGFLLVHIDLAPNFSASLMGITNFIANIMSIIAPLVCGLIVKDETNPSEWRTVFLLSAGVYVFTNIFFLVFGTSERQTWNEPIESDTEMNATGAK